MAIAIPVLWRALVLDALDDYRVTTPIPQFQERLIEDFPGATLGEIEKAFEQFLRSPTPQGCLAKMKTSAGQAWEFFFQFKGKKKKKKKNVRENSPEARQ